MTHAVYVNRHERALTSGKCHSVCAVDNGTAPFTELFETNFLLIGKQNQVNYHRNLVYVAG